MATFVEGSTLRLSVGPVSRDAEGDVAVQVRLLRDDDVLGRYYEGTLSLDAPAATRITGTLAAAGESGTASGSLDVELPFCR